MTGSAARRANARKAARGGYPGCAPVGYLNATDAGRRVTCPIPSRRRLCGRPTGCGDGAFP